MGKIISKFLVIASIVSLFVTITIPNVINEAAADTIFSDDFESYTLGTFPSSGGWELVYSGAGSSYQYVDNTHAVSGTKSLHLIGSYCWSANAYHDVNNIPSSVKLEGMVFVNQIVSCGCEHILAGIELNNPDLGAWGTGYGQVGFSCDGNIYAMQDSYDSTKDILLMPYNAGNWYRVEIDVDLTWRTFNVYIDGVLRGFGLQILNSGLPTGVEVSAAHGGNPTVWFDDVNIILLQIVPIPKVSRTYKYDKLNRLTQISYEDGNNISYTYDAVGNRISITLGTVVSTPSPTPSPTPTSGWLGLSKNTAYLSGDTIVATVVDGDRNVNVNYADILTTSLRVTGADYSVGTDLILDLQETNANSGSFLATIKTGASTQGGADQQGATHPDNEGTIKTIQSGTANVIYTDTAPSASSVTKQITFSSCDATLAFDADSYALGQYAILTMADAEQNTNKETSQTLLDSVFVKTSASNVAKVRMVESGADTGTFVGSILVASSGATTDLQKIVAASDDTLTSTYTDEVNTTGTVRLVTDTALVSAAVIATPTPTPTATVTVTKTPTATKTPTPTATPTPTPIICDEATDIEVEPNLLILIIRMRDTVVVTVTGEDGCPVEGDTVRAKVYNPEIVKVSPRRQATDENGEAVFTIKAQDKAGNAVVIFRDRGLTTQVSVKVVK